MRERQFRSFVDGLTPKEKEAYQRSPIYKEKMDGFEDFKRFSEQADASLARGETSWTTDSFNGPLVAKEDQDEEADCDPESDDDDAKD